MMYLGKNAVGIAKLKDGIGNNWNSMQITNSTAIRLGNELANWLQTALPKCTIAIGILNYDWSNGTPTTTGIVYEFFWIGRAESSSFLRVLNNTFEIL